MQFSEQTISSLLQLQQLDLALLQAKKKFEELPQRQAILEVRKKKSAILQKRDQVLLMKADVDAKVAKVISEDEDLAEKQQEVQKTIEQGGSGYRDLEARTKELNGHAKRRAALADMLVDLDEQQQKVAAAEGQIDGMLKQVESIEQKHIASFQKEGGALQLQIAQLTAQREDVFESIEPAAEKEYGKAAKACGGVAIGVLNGTKCGVCRTPLDDGQLMNVRSQAPVGRCPHCKRLLVVPE